MSIQAFQRRPTQNFRLQERPEKINLFLCPEVRYQNLYDASKLHFSSGEHTLSHSMLSLRGRGRASVLQVMNDLNGTSDLQAFT
jgi:hypothetical protein